MEDRLLHNILKLQMELQEVHERLDIAMQGLKAICSHGLDKYNIASKTLNEIDNI